MAMCNPSYTRLFILALFIPGLGLMLKAAPSVHPDEPAIISHASAQSSPGLHDLWDVILQIYVSLDGLVDYKALKLADDDLNEYLGNLAKEVPDGSWAQEDALAYWVNAYNAFTIRLVLDHYPIASIKEAFNGKPFDEKWIELAGNQYSLNQIEKDIIFGQTDDPRLHFALNCAAKSCPPLYYKAFRGELLDKQLELVTHKFVNDDSRNTITNSRIEVSRIFDWYKKDFKDLRDFLYRYSMSKIPAGVGIRYKDYDWSLNERK